MKKTIRIIAIIGCLWFISSGIPAFSQETYKFELMWGSRGAGDGQFDTPVGVAVSSSGNVYVADYNNGRIQKFDSTGSFISKWATYFPERVAVDSLGNVYVCCGYQIQKFDTNGNFLNGWIVPLDPFNVLQGIAVDPSGNVYVVVSYQCFLSACPIPLDRFCIQKFDSHGNFITKLGSEGSGDGQFLWPEGVAVDLSGNVYVADAGNSRVQKFDSNGSFITKWEIPYYLSGIGTDLSGNVYVTIKNCGPTATSPKPRIWKFGPTGNLIAKWDDVVGNCSYYSSGLAVNSLGSVYVADTNNHRVQKFSQILEMTTVPTLTEWGMIILIALLGMISIYSFRSQQIVRQKVFGKEK